MSVDVEALLGDQASYLLEHKCGTISQDMLTLPGPNFVSEVMAQTDRSPQVMRNMQSLLNTGRLGGSGYVSILPVDQGIEHTAGASFAPNPDYFDPEKIVPDASLDELGISSVDLVQVMFQVEEEFDVYLADEEVGVDTQNVGQLLDAVEKLIEAKAA